MQTTAEFSGNSTANITLSKETSLSFLTSNNFFTKSKNVAVKILCGGVVALEIPRKLTCGSSFCNVVGFNTQISMELGYNREIYLKSLRRTISQKSDFESY